MVPLLSVLLLCALLFGALRWGARRSAYYPLRYPQGDWNLRDALGAADVWIETPDRVRIHGWWVEPEQRADAGAQPLATLFLHGNAGNVTHRAGHIREVTAAGSAMLVLDYRGYGRSQGSPSEPGLYADAASAWDFLRRRGFAPERIILHGESLGTAVAVDLAARQPCGGLVLESAFSSGRELAATLLPGLGPLLFSAYDALARIPKVSCPILFFHGSRDDLIPVRFGRKLFDAAPGAKRFCEIPAAGHNDLLESAGGEYRERLAAFYQEVRRTLSPEG